MTDPVFSGLTSGELPPSGIAPDDIGLDSKPQVHPEVAALVVRGETVLLGEGGVAHVLNATGTLVWRFLDGVTPLRELVDDFVSALDADRPTVEDELVEFTRTLGMVGLLDGVVQPGDAGAFDGDWTPAEPVAVGDELEPLTLSDLEGQELSLDAWRGRRVLLVNWSPDCGFCVQIAAELGEAEVLLAQEGIDLVFLTRGDPDENRQVFADARLTAPSLLQDGDSEAFDGFGTPSAYLLDAEGRVEAPLVVGAIDVPRFVAELIGRDLPDEPNTIAEGTGAPEGARYLPAPSAVCGPGGGGGGATTDDWAGTWAYGLGEVHIGLRYNSQATAELLDRLLPGLRVDDPGVPDNYSVALHTDAEGGARRLNLLVHGGTQLVRSRSAGRVLAALLAYLAVDTSALRADERLLPVAVTAGVRGGEALLLPADLRAWLKELQPRLARRGIALVDGPVTFIDVATRELVVPEPAIPFDGSVLDAVDEGIRLGAEQPWVRAGRYPLSDWYLPSSQDTPSTWSPAQAVAGAYGQIVSVDSPEVVGRQLAHVFEGVRAHGVWLSSPDALDDQLSSTSAA